MLIAIGAAVISIILGVVGAATSIHPPQAQASKRLVLVTFGLLSLLAVVFTIASYVQSSRQEAAKEAQLRALTQDLKDVQKSMTHVIDQNTELLNRNADLRSEVATRTPRTDESPSVAADLALKQDIEQHLANVQRALAASQKEFQSTALSIPSAEYPTRYEAHRRALAAMYARDYYPRSRELLKRAAQLGLIPDEDFGIDQRFIDAGLIPYLNDLAQVASRLPR